MSGHNMFYLQVLFLALKNGPKAMKKIISVHFYIILIW